MKTPLELLRRVDAQAQGGHLRKSLRDDDLVSVYLSASLLREIAAVCNRQSHDDARGVMARSIREQIEGAN